MGVLYTACDVVWEDDGCGSRNHLLGGGVKIVATCSCEGCQDGDAAFCQITLDICDFTS